jgi:hypothetical protein
MKYRDKIIEMHEEGLLNSETLVRNLVGWLSEDDAREFAEANGYTEEEEEPEESEDSDESED